MRYIYEIGDLWKEGRKEMCAYGNVSWNQRSDQNISIERDCPATIPEQLKIRRMAYAVT